MGGLGIKSTHGTTKKALLRQVWNVVSQKNTCWNLWVKAKYLRGESFWDVMIPKNASWGWKNILMLKPIAIPHIKFLVGNGHQIKFWTDPWLNGGRLEDCYGDRAVYDLGMGADIKVHQFIQTDGWRFPTPKSDALMDVFQSIPIEIEAWPNFKDELVWTPEDHGNFTLKSAYNLVCRNWDQSLQWPSMIWFKGCIKKHSICAWMLLRGRLKTKDFLLQRNVACDCCCVHCNYTWETAIHLMIKCPYSQEVWKALLSKLNLEPIRCTNPLKFLASITVPMNQQAKGLQTHGKLLFNAFIWHIRAVRNGRIFRTKEHSSKFVLHQIIQTVCSRILYLDIALPSEIANHWNVPPSNSSILRKLPTLINSRWRVSICSIDTLIVVILWSEVHTPMECHIQQELTYFKAVFQIIQLIPDNVTHITFEADSTLHQVLLNPQVSDWKVCFRVRRLHAFIQKFEHIQYMMLHPRSARFSKVLSINLATFHINQNVVTYLYKQSIGNNE